MIHELREEISVLGIGVAVHLVRQSQPVLQCSQTILIMHVPPLERFAVLWHCLVFDQAIDFYDELLKQGNTCLAFALEIPACFLNFELASNPRQRKALNNQGDKDDAKGQEQDDMAVRKRLAVQCD